jgi:hypothetical protein
VIESREKERLDGGRDSLEAEAIDVAVTGLGAAGWGVVPTHLDAREVTEKAPASSTAKGPTPGASLLIPEQFGPTLLDDQAIH